MDINKREEVAKKMRGLIDLWSTVRMFCFYWSFVGYYGTYNPGHNILGLYNILVKIRFSKSKSKLDI